MMAFLHSEPAKGGQRTEHQFRELARLSFGHPENLAPLQSRGGNPLPTVADCKTYHHSEMTNYIKPSKMSNSNKIKPRGRPKASGIRKLSKSVTVKFSRIDYERLLHRSRQANRTLAEFIREAAFDTRIVARHSTEETTVMRNLVGMANNLNQLTRLSHQTGFYRTRNAVMELLEKLKVIMNEYKT